MKKEIMIVTGEASGDLHGARLVQSMCSLQPDLQFCGVGGIELKAAGVELLFEASRIAVVGFFEVASHLPDIINAQRVLRRRLAQSRPALLILIDFPDFNLLLARKAKKLNIPVFYYISPQVWAWRSGRVKTIQRLVDKIGVILPFEEKFYRDRGVDANYVGHPLLDSVPATGTRQQFCKDLKIPEGRKLIGILPGSRLKEVRRLLSVFLEAAVLFQEKSHDRPVFLLPCASTLTEEELLESGLAEYQARLDIRVVFDNRYELMSACDVVIAASGTVTLELLLLNTPMVVAYRLSPRTYQIGRFIVNVDFFALVNLIAGRQVVPELLQDDANPERISTEMYQLVYDDDVRSKMMRGFDEVRERLGGPGASRKAAELALSLFG